MTGDMPFITRNSVGAGRAYLCASPEWSLVEKPEVLDQLWKEAIGEPVSRVTMNPERYQVRIRRLGDRTVVHVIDSLAASEGPMARYRPLYTKLAVNTRVVPFEKAVIVPDKRPLSVSLDGIWKVMEIYPNPELTIILENHP